MDYKDTLNLPKTSFPMKANLPQRETLILTKWSNLYKKIQQEFSKKEIFVLHDGPPYANGNIHIGHALNKILKDIINKFNLISGKRINYIPGWDCHGLPIEQQVEKSLKKDKKTKESVGKINFRKMCREYANKFVEIQKKEFIRLGVLANWENPYITMDPKYQATEIRELGKIFKRGLVVRSKKPVYWCIYDKTAEAEAEVEYKNREDPSIYVKFPLVKNENTFLLIWTTTPWTLPANLGVMVGESYDYVFFEEGSGNVYIVAADLLTNITEKIGIQGKVIKEIKGKDLIGIEYKHPFIERIGKVYPSEFVTLTSGTGLVHMAPGHGVEDYTVGLRYNLEPLSPVDEEGRFTKDAPQFLRGLRVFEANELIISELEKRNLLLYKETISHSYPHCWRCKNPVIFRATAQWFIKMDSEIEGKTLRERALEEIEKVRWIPEYGKNRIRSMIEVRPDWCISRQRYWGVPITVFYCNGCGEIIADEEIFEHIADIVENHPEGADIWFQAEAKELLPKGFRCKNCGSEDFRKEEDILDVWFDSGCSHVYAVRALGTKKADLYLEGSDQHRGWFQASLLESVSSYGEAPYKAVLTHGFVVDEKGKKMSKSEGNVISPQEIIENYGADILRLWVVSEDYTEDIKIGQNILRMIVEDYRKIRNTARFMLSNLYDFNPQKDKVDYKELHHFDKWILSKFQSVTKQAISSYKEYKFHHVYHTLRNFSSRELSSIYFDVIKDRLYIYERNSWERRSAQTALYEILLKFCIILSPILSFTAEEIWEYIREIDPLLPESVFLYDGKLYNESMKDENIEKDYDILLKLREDVMKALEEARKSGYIKHPYEAKVYLSTEHINTIKRYWDYINYFFTVSQIEEGEGGEIRIEATYSKVGISKAEGKKCPRCWVYFKESEFEGDVCKRCATVLKNMKVEHN